MKYFFDTEFIEGSQPIKFMGFKIGESKPTIDLISIGIVAEDGREYYAISKDFNLDYAWSNLWVRQNVLLKIYQEKISGDARNYVPFTKANFKGLLNGFGKSNNEIAFEILCFVHELKDRDFSTWLGSFEELWQELRLSNPPTPPEFWAYFADYDWVVFCQIFGKMIDLPNGFPFFCMDLKNLMEFKGLSKEWKQEVCPDPIGEHNALVDAKWNKMLFEKIASV